MADRAVRWNIKAERRNGYQPGQVGEVMAGPFAGLVYPEEIAESVVSAKLKRNGTYEQALAPVVAAEFDRGPAEFVDVGAAEGFYAVSAARRGIPTTAYESSSIQRKALRRLAEANGAEVEVRRHCRRVPKLQDNTLLLMDVEGAEMQLLDGIAGERLRGTTVIVELHEHLVPGVTDAVEGYFANTHASESIRGESELARGGGEPAWAVYRPR